MRFEVIDGDGHVVERGSELARYGVVRGATPRIQGLLDRERRAEWDYGIQQKVGEGLYDIEQRLKDMDKEGVDVAVNFATPLMGVSDFPDAQDSTLASQAYNSWYAGTYCKANPDRFKLVAIVPMQNVEGAVREARRAVRELGAVAIFIPPYCQALSLDNPMYEPLWATIESLGVPIGIHGGGHDIYSFVRDGRFATHLRSHSMCHPFQQMKAMADLVCGGVLERYPKLKIGFMESGVGWMPYFIARLDEDYEKIGYQEPKITRKPSEYILSGRCWFSCESDEPMLPAALKFLGEDRVIYASDYPHWDCRFPDSVTLLTERGDLSSRAKKKILGDNAKTLYGL